MSILDSVSAQVAVVEATDAAAVSLINSLKTDKAALETENATLKAQVADLQNETAAAQALADQLKASNDALQAAVTPPAAG